MQPTTTQSAPQQSGQGAPSDTSSTKVPPISGRYYGLMRSPRARRYGLELRIDVDARSATSPVMQCVSGDVYQVFELTWMTPLLSWRTYRYSWILDAPQVARADNELTISGPVRYWQGAHPATSVEIVVPQGKDAPGPAYVTLHIDGEEPAVYMCEWQSEAFREVGLEMDVCSSVNTPPLLPSFDTHTHPLRPADVPRRVLTIEECYRDAGVKMTIDPEHTVVDDSAPEFSAWSAAELHDAMERHFCRQRGVWPQWHLWCLIASRFEMNGVGGIMFDAAADYGGAGDCIERQGCAIFRQHSWFRDLAPTPRTEAQAAAARKYLYTCVHEMGHVFNCLHSWDKGRPDARSWMNYDWRYDRRNGSDSFWRAFRYQFDDAELVHLRHGDRSAVIMGGDPWGSGAYAEAPPEVLGQPPVELLLRSKGAFEFMEPVLVEFRLRNMAPVALELDAQLDPAFGGTVVTVRRPDGRTVAFEPLLCQIAEPELRALQPPGKGPAGLDRYSQNVLLSYGRWGYVFDEPGEYLVWAVYQGAGDMLIPSNVHRIRVGYPRSREAERLAQDYFSRETGVAQVLGGSSSPFLQKGMDTLQAVAEQFEDSPPGAHANLLLSRNLARPFFQIEDAKVVKARAAEPKQALALTVKALSQHKRDGATFTNLTYHTLRRTRADLMVAMREPEAARQELSLLVRDLRKQGVNAPVLDEIQAYAKSL